MLILGFEASAKSASVALVRDGELIAQYYQRSGLTHSRTLLPMAEDLLKNAEIPLDSVDLFAVSQGPGSFTGIRIGVATVKGLCWASDKPAVGVSTLEAMAYNGISAQDGTIICCAMDARRNQVYNALFEIKDSVPQRLCPDRAVSLEDLRAELEFVGRPVSLTGDGALLCYESFKSLEQAVTLAPEPVRYQSAWGVCMAAMSKEPRPAGELLPVYLRLPQAERERQARTLK